MTTSYSTEFPDFDAATLPAIPAAWEDISWRNDSCPAFMVAELAKGSVAWRNLIVYVDFADAAQREHPETARFSVLDTGAHRALEGTKELFSSDDWEAVLRFIRHESGYGVPALAQAFVAELRRDLGAETFEEVRRRNRLHTDNGMTGSCATHEFRDANMIMESAFRNAFGKGPLDGDSEGFDDADLALWNEAWTLAKESELTAPVASPVSASHTAAPSRLQAAATVARDMLHAHLSETFGPYEDWTETVFWEAYSGLDDALKAEATAKPEAVVTVTDRAKG